MAAVIAECLAEVMATRNNDNVDENSGVVATDDNR